MTEEKAMQTQRDLTSYLHEAVENRQRNLLTALQKWFVLVDTAEDLHHKAFQLLWHGEGMKQERYIAEHVALPHRAWANALLAALVDRHVFDETLILSPFRDDPQTLFSALKNIVFLLSAGFTLRRRLPHDVSEKRVVNILFLGNIEVYTAPFLRLSNAVPNVRLFAAFERRALLLQDAQVYLKYGMVFAGEEAFFVDSTDQPIEVHYVYNKTKKADPELSPLRIPLSGDPSFENLVDSKILTNKVLQNAGVARPRCLSFVPPTFTNTVPSRLVDALHLLSDPNISVLNVYGRERKKTIDAALCQFDVADIVVKPNLGRKGEGITFFRNQLISDTALGNRELAGEAIDTILESGDGVVVEERIVSPDQGKSVIRAIGVSNGVQGMTGLDIVLDQHYKPLFLEANGNRSAGLNWLLQFGQRDAVQKVLDAMIQVAQAYKDGEKSSAGSVECAGFFVKMWTKAVEKPVNTSLGAITQSWTQWAETNVPRDVEQRVRGDIEALVRESFEILQQMALFLKEDGCRG
jgi:hypothetical protein